MQFIPDLSHLCLSPFVHRKKLIKGVDQTHSSYFSTSPVLQKIIIMLCRYALWHTSVGILSFLLSSHTIWSWQHFSLINPFSIFFSECFPHSFFSHFFSPESSGHSLSFNSSLKRDFSCSHVPLSAPFSCPFMLIFYALIIMSTIIFKHLSPDKTYPKPTSEYPFLIVSSLWISHI